MKNENYEGKHGHDPDNSEFPVPRRASPDFHVNLSEEDLATGSDYIYQSGEYGEGMNSKYNFDNFSQDASYQMPRSEQFLPRSEEINSFSTNNAKNTAMRKDKTKFRHQKREFRKIRKEKDRNNRNIFRLFWIVSCLVVGIVLGQYLLVGLNDFLAINRTSNETVILEISENPDIDSIAELLAEKGVIKSKTYFTLFSKITKKADNFRQGTFEISKNLDYQAIISFLQSNSNRSDIVRVQFTEGMNIVEIAQKLKDNKVISDTEKFLNLCNTDEFDEEYTFLQEASNDDKYYKLEGYMYPDTYDFYINEDPKSVIEKFISNFETRVYYDKRVIPGYDRKTALGKLLRESEYSVDEIMIIASIIQAEALNEEDMYNISSVIHNRLKADPDSGVLKLNCDSTVYYPYRNLDDIPEELSGYLSRYDTYNIQGLPAGAICNPGAEAIRAALVPNETDYLYFCHSHGTDEEPAKAYYATNLDDHNYNRQLAGLTDGE